MARKRERLVEKSEKKQLPLLIAFGLLVLTWGVFGRCLAYPFINYDDPAYILEKPQITAGVTLPGLAWCLTHPHGGNWHPVTSMSHMLDCQLFGLNPAGHHAVNVALHSISVVLLFIFLRSLTHKTWRSAAVAALFAIHPLRVESVVWIAERKDVLSGVFFMLILIAYLRYVRKRSAARYVTILILLAVGLMAKAMLVTVPVVLLILDWWLPRIPDTCVGNSARGGWRRLIVEKLPMFALAVLSSITTIWAQKEAITSVALMPLWERIGNALLSYGTYLLETIWPTKLALFYPLDENNAIATAAVTSTAVLGLLSAAVIYLRRRFPYLIVGWCWYLVMLLPVIGLVQVGLQSHADRYTYLPSIGIVIGVVWLVADLAVRLQYRKPLVALIGCTTLLILSACTWTQLSYWRDSETLWQRTLAVTSRNYLAHAYLADLLVRQQRFDEAIAHSEEALRIRPTNSDAHNNLALALFRTGRLKEAVPHWQRSLEIAPHNRNAEATYAWILATSPDASFRDGPKAVLLLEDVIGEAGRDNPMVLRGLGAAYAESGRFAEAIATAEEAIKLASAQQNRALTEDLGLNIVNYKSHLPLRDAGVATGRQ